jgi:hypothetical protein
VYFNYWNQRVRQRVVNLVAALARQMPYESIAAVLNRSGKSTSHGRSWTRMRICSLRKQKGIAVYREGERDERGEATLNEAAEQLSVSPSTIRRISMPVPFQRANCAKAPPGSFVMPT